MSFQKITQAICFGLLMGMIVGCQQYNAAVDSKSDNASQTPRHGLKLHKPKNLCAAVERLVEINGSLLSDEPFPQPIKIDYVEVIHGSGPAGHSHFYPADSYDANGEDDDHDAHHEEDETTKRLVAEIPLRTELADIVKWLPDVAAKSNASEATWTTISDTSKSLTKIIDAIGKDASDTDFRDAWKKQSKEIAPMIDKLETLATESTGAVK